MSNEYFRFKQFTVWHDRCAMKVGTDGVLLGATVNVGSSRRVLDVGTGTGLVALMVAQRCPEAEITAIEIDSSAADQAKENVERSPWSDRITVVNTDFKDFVPNGRFDTIVSNPPYFSESLLPPDRQRTSARHTTELDYTTLFAHSAELLTPDGELTIIIPTAIVDDAERIGRECGLYFVRRLSIVTRYGAESKRTVATFAFRNVPCRADVLYMEDENRNFTDEYRSLADAFYLNMPLRR